MSRESDRIPDRSSKVPLEYVRVPRSRIVQAIHLIRGHRVLLDADLAVLYEVETKALTRAVRRNQERFPEDFMFQLSKEEFEDLRSQSGASSQWGGIVNARGAKRRGIVR